MPERPKKEDAVDILVHRSRFFHGMPTISIGQTSVSCDAEQLGQAQNAGLRTWLGIQSPEERLESRIRARRARLLTRGDQNG